MSKNAMAGAVTLCGVGLCLIGGALMMQSGGQAHAAALPAAVAAVGAAASAQAKGEPTVVWYGVSPKEFDGAGQPFNSLWRAWSDGTVEARRVGVSTSGYCNSASIGCMSGWMLVSSPTQGFRASADIDANELVDGADLASILIDWGDAPRVPFPPSDCPLNLINP